MLDMEKKVEEICEFQDEAAVYVIDSDRRILRYNEAFDAWYPHAKLGMHCYEAVCGEMYPCLVCPFQKGGSGRKFYYDNRLHTWIDALGGPMNVSGSGNDTVLVAKQVQIDKETIFSYFTSESHAGRIMELNITQNSWRTIYRSDGKASAVPQNTLRETIAKVREEYVYPDDRARHAAFWDLDTLYHRLVNETRHGFLWIQLREKAENGGWMQVEQMIMLQPSNRAGDFVVLSFTKAYDEEKMPDQVSLRGMVNTRSAGVGIDPLTGLHGTSLFYKRVSAYLEEHPHEELCILAIDIPQLRVYNYLYGREAGDALLLALAEPLKEAQALFGTYAAHFSDDDFAILMPQNEEYISRLCEKLLDSVDGMEENSILPPKIGGYHIQDCSVAVEMMVSLAKNAYLTRPSTQNSPVCWHDTKLLQQSEDEWVTLSACQTALNRDEFTFYLQPKCQIDTGEIIGAEALIRWDRPGHGMVSPGKFIPVLEKSGTITKVDCYIWEAVCRWLRQRLDEGKRVIPISVNVSRKDIENINIAEHFSMLAEQYQIPPHLLHIEITESACVETGHMIRYAVDALHNYGFSILLDDFGTGYSSLNSLKDIAVDVLKLDMKFLDITGENQEKGTIILKSMIEMGMAMSVPLLAEGVETEEQAKLLSKFGCQLAQGYYFYRPMPISQMEEILDQMETS